MAAIIWTDTRIIAELEGLVAWLREDESRYWVKDYANERGYPGCYFRQWADKGPNYRELYDLAQEIQESRLFHRGAEGAIKEGMAKFGLMKVAGWREGVDNKTEHSGGIQIVDFSKVVSDDTE